MKKPPFTISHKPLLWMFAGLFVLSLFVLLNIASLAIPIRSGWPWLITLLVSAIALVVSIRDWK